MTTYTAANDSASISSEDSVDLDLDYQSRNLDDQFHHQSGDILPDDRPLIERPRTSHQKYRIQQVTISVDYTFFPSL